MQTKPEIIEGLEDVFGRVQGTMESLTNEQLTTSVENRWHALEQYDHLIRSAKPIGLLNTLPKFGLLIYGKNKGPSRSYDEVNTAYLKLLDEGAKATGAYIPGPLQAADLPRLTGKWNAARKAIITGLDKWSENDLDTYRAVHPFLKKMTVRELLFFTHLHTEFHLKRIRAVLN